MIQRKMLKGKIKIYKTLCRKLNIEEHESHLKPEMNSGFLKGLATWYLHKQGVNRGCNLCRK